MRDNQAVIDTTKFPHLTEALIEHPEVLCAFVFATGAHAAIGQVRKYTGDPYIIHPIEVAEIVAGVRGISVEAIVAALLHDVVEDTGVSHITVQQLFGEKVSNYVIHLTDYFTPENFPSMNRAARKSQEAMRYMLVPNEVKTIKLADGLNNTVSIAAYDPGFMKTYGVEKRYLLQCLEGGNRELWEALDRMLIDAGY